MRRSTAHGVTRRLGGEEGMGIVTVVSLAAIVFLLGVSWTTTARHQVASSAHERSREQALQAAEAGVHDAMSRLSVDVEATTVPLTSLDQGGDRFGEYEAEISAPYGMDDKRRKIAATGYWPAKTSERVVVRKVEALVQFVVVDEFSAVLFAGDGKLEVRDSFTGEGNLFSRGRLMVTSGAIVNGSVIAWDDSEVDGSITGDLRVTGELELDGSIGGNVFVSHVAGDPNTGGKVDGSGSVGGNLTVPGTVNRGISVTGSVYSLQPPFPPSYPMPEFTWDASNYPSVQFHASVSDFNSYVQTNALLGIHGVHRISGTGTVELKPPPLASAWTLGGDLTVYAPDAKIQLQKNVSVGLGVTGPRLTLISLKGSVPHPAVEFIGDVAIPSDVRTLVFGPNGKVDADGGTQSMYGVVYAGEIDLQPGFTITFRDVGAVPGFSWPLSAFDPLEILLFAEVPPP